MATNSRRKATFIRRMARSKLLRVAVTYSFICGQLVLAAPQGEQVVNGQAAFNRQGSLTEITASHNAIINYQSFDIHTHETVRFIQPSAAARVLNRIQGPDPTTIAGSLIANGQVYIVNPAGVLFTETARIDVARLVAAAASISNQDFLSNIDRFTDVHGSVVNHGQINADFVGLVGRHVANYGTILAPEGMIAMVAGEDVLLGRFDDPLMIKITGGAANLDDAGDAPGVENHGTLEADSVRLSAGDMFSILLDHDSHIKANEIIVEGGAGSTVHVAGTLDASNRASGRVGGDIKILGERVGVDHALIDVSGDAGGGRIWIGGNLQGIGDLRNAARTLFGADAEVFADALSFGKGGDVIVWADEVLGFYGSIQARGGAQGGNGGFVETSGKEQLLFHGDVDLTAVQGQTGTLLLDPMNIVISDTGAGTLPADDGGTPPTTTVLFGLDPSGTSTFSDETIEAALDGANLILQANNDITLEAGAEYYRRQLSNAGPG